MFAPIWKGYFPEENHVGYVTNGVHLPTWCAAEWKKLFKDNFDENFSATSPIRKSGRPSMASRMKRYGIPG